MKKIIFTLLVLLCVVGCSNKKSINLSADKEGLIEYKPEWYGSKRHESYQYSFVFINNVSTITATFWEDGMPKYAEVDVTKEEYQKLLDLCSKSNLRPTVTKDEKGNEIEEEPVEAILIHIKEDKDVNSYCADFNEEIIAYINEIYKTR